MVKLATSLSRYFWPVFIVVSLLATFIQTYPAARQLTDARGFDTQLTFDWRGNVTQIQHPDGNTVVNQYQLKGSEPFNFIPSPARL